MSKVVCEVSCWRFSLDDASRSGRPAEVDNDQIKTLIENNQHYITQEIADILKISKSIKLLVKMKNVSFRGEKMDFLANPPNLQSLLAYQRYK